VKTQGALVPGDPFPAVVQEQTWSFGEAPPLQPDVILSLADVGSLRVDVPRAGIATGNAGTVHVTTDGPTTVALSGVRAGFTVRLDGVPVTRVPRSGTVAVAVPPGAHSITFG